MQADLNLKMLIFTVQAPRYQRGLSQPCPVLDSSETIYLSVFSQGLRPGLLSVGPPGLLSIHFLDTTLA